MVVVMVVLMLEGVWLPTTLPLLAEELGRAVATAQSPHLVAIIIGISTLTRSACSEFVAVLTIKEIFQVRIGTILLDAVAREASADELGRKGRSAVQGGTARGCPRLRRKLLLVCAMRRPGLKGLTDWECGPSMSCRLSSQNLMTSLRWLGSGPRPPERSEHPAVNGHNFTRLACAAFARSPA